MRHPSSAVPAPPKKNSVRCVPSFLCALACLIASPLVATVMGRAQQPDTVPVIAPGLGVSPD